MIGEVVALLTDAPAEGMTAEDLAVELEVSATMVRAWLRVLQAQGAVVRHPATRGTGNGSGAAPARWTLG